MNKTYSLINTDLHRPIRSTSLADTRNDIDYRDIHLQEIVRDAFQGVFPSIVQIDQKWVYQLLSEKGKDRCSKASVINSYKDIPSSEINKLLEGWIVLRRAAMEGNVSNNLHSILLNFRVPHPEKSIDCYRLEKQNGKDRLIVLWGYESDSNPSISLEKALVIMLGVDRDELKRKFKKSIASAKQGERVKVGTDFVNTIPKPIASESVLVSAKAENKKKSVGSLAVILLFLLALVAVILWGSSILKKGEIATGDRGNQKVENLTNVVPVYNSVTEPIYDDVIVYNPSASEVEKVEKVNPYVIMLEELHANRDKRSQLIEFFKADKLIVETKEGLLEAKSNMTERVTKVVDEENKDRQLTFELKSKIEGVSLAATVANFATSMGVDINKLESKTILRIHGSNTVGASLAPKLVTQFLRDRGVNDVSIHKDGVESSISYEEGGVENVIEIKAHGSSTAFNETDANKKVGLAGGYCDLGMSSRPIKSSEVEDLMQKGFQDMSSPGAEYPIALDGVAVILHPSNPISKLTVKQIAGIYAGKIKNWEELGGSNELISIYARDEQSGTWDTFKSSVMKPYKYKLPESGVMRYEDSALLVSQVAQNKASIGFCGLAYVNSSVKGLAVQAGDGTTAFEPNRLTVKTQDYPLARLLYFYLPNDAPQIAHEFVNFTMSNDGQQVVDKAGLVGQGLSTKVDLSNADAYKKKLLENSNIPDDYKALIKNADRREVQSNLRFASGSMSLDVNSKNNILRLVSFLAESGNEDTEVILIGFADSSGSAVQNLSLSIKRAEVAAELLKSKGVHKVSPHGFGEAMPVADNATVAGREKNRRLEVWLQH